MFEFNYQIITEDIIDRVKEAECEDGFRVEDLPYLITLEENRQGYWRGNDLASIKEIQENFETIRYCINNFDYDTPYDVFKETIKFHVEFMIDFYATICEKMLEDANIDIHHESHTIEEVYQALIKAKKEGAFAHYSLAHISI